MFEVVVKTQFGFLTFYTKNKDDADKIASTLFLAENVIWTEVRDETGSVTLLGGSHES